MNEVHSILWQRLDVPGHDACQLRKAESRWQLNGTAVFLGENAQAAQLHYRVECDLHWHSLAARIEGWIGKRPVELSIGRDDTGAWAMNGCRKEGLAHCIDLDLGFTPATNLIALRRLDLAVGQASQAPAAWLDIANTELGLLRQSYGRTGPSSYLYAAPQWHYEESLQVDAIGFVIDYPKLWRRASDA